MQAGTIRKQACRSLGLRARSWAVSLENSVHQVTCAASKQMAALTTPHTAEFKFGEASLRIVASPALNSDGQRVGTVVQWTDRTQVVAKEEEVQRR